MGSSPKELWFSDYLSIRLASSKTCLLCIGNCTTGCPGLGAVVAEDVHDPEVSGVFVELGAVEVNSYCIRWLSRSLAE